MREYFGDVAGVRIGDTNKNNLLQADDLIIFSETRAGLQNLLQRLELYCRWWHLILNTDKTKAMIFNAKYEILRELNNFTFEKHVIDQVSSYKYLGVIVSNQSDRFSEQYSYLKDKTLNAIIAANIYIKQAVKGQLPIHLYLKVFDTQIRPVSEYASEVWLRGNPIEELEQVHLIYLKTVLGVKQSTPTTAVLGETGRFLLHMRFQDRIVKMWVRINKLPSHHLHHKIYNESMRLGQLGHNTWALTSQTVMRSSCITKTSIGLIIRCVDWDTTNLSRCRSSIYTKITDGQNWIRTISLKIITVLSPIYYTWKIKII